MDINSIASAYVLENVRKIFFCVNFLLLSLLFAQTLQKFKLLNKQYHSKDNYNIITADHNTQTLDIMNR